MLVESVNPSNNIHGNGYLVEYHIGLLQQYCEKCNSILQNWPEKYEDYLTLVDDGATELHDKEKWLQILIEKFNALIMSCIFRIELSRYKIATLIEEKPPTLTKLNYKSWVKLYKLWLESRWAYPDDRRKENMEKWSESHIALPQDRRQDTVYKEEAIAYYKKVISTPGDMEDKVLKIRSLFDLVRLHAEDHGSKGELYFYEWVAMIRRYLSDTLEIGKSDREKLKEFFFKYESFAEILPEMLDIYRTLIHPKSGDDTDEEIISSILTESDARSYSRIKKMASAKAILSLGGSSSNVLNTLEEVIWPIRLFIKSEESGDMTSIHWSAIPPDTPLEQISPYIYPITANIFDRPRLYSVIIDSGSAEQLSQFEKSEFDFFIQPMVAAYIERLQGEFFGEALKNNKELEELEEYARRLPWQNGLTTNFIAKVLSQLPPDEIGNILLDEYYIAECLQAIEICRIISKNHKSQSKVDIDHWIDSVDQVLWWKINRSVMSKVESMLISQHENMNGTGYPFWLSKERIPLEGRIYKIIRAYESLRYKVSHNDALSKLDEWWKGWYFDPQMLKIFFESFRAQSVPKVKKRKRQKRIPMTPYRNFTLSNYLSLSQIFIDTGKSIGNDYGEVRNPEPGISRSDIYSKIYTKQDNLRRATNNMVLIIITRHGETESDIPGGRVGEASERLSQSGEKSSAEKWKFLSKILLQIHTSPLERAIQSAEIIVEEIQKDLKPSTPWIKIIIEPSLDNPQKNYDNGRTGSYLERLVADNPTELMYFVKQLFSLPGNTTKLIVTHRDTARHAILMITNFASRDTIKWSKVTVDNNTIDTYILRWGEVLKDVLLFTISNWQSLLWKINRISEEVFGEKFYAKPPERVDLIALHNLFLDYIDHKKDLSRKKLLHFTTKLSADEDLIRFAKMAEKVSRER